MFYVGFLAYEFWKRNEIVIQLVSRVRLVFISIMSFVIQISIELVGLVSFHTLNDLLW